MPHIPIQIRIATRKANRVLAQPAADRSIVPAVNVVLKSRVTIKSSTRE